MKTQKLSLNDFEAVGTAELLEIKGGNRFIVTPDNFRRTYLNGPINNEEGGGCVGDSNGFGDTNDADEVVVVAGQEAALFTQPSPEPDCPDCTFSYAEANSSRNWGRTWAWYSHWLYNPDGAHRCD